MYVSEASRYPSINDWDTRKLSPQLDEQFLELPDVYGQQWHGGILGDKHSRAEGGRSLVDKLRL
jgi:hypothetical protein